jgi:hypothetical protein
MPYQLQTLSTIEKSQALIYNTEDKSSKNISHFMTVHYCQIKYIHKVNPFQVDDNSRISHVMITIDVQM